MKSNELSEFISIKRLVCEMYELDPSSVSQEQIKQFYQFLVDDLGICPATSATLDVSIALVNRAAFDSALLKWNNYKSNLETQQKRKKQRTNKKRYAKVKAEREKVKAAAKLNAPIKAGTTLPSSIQPTEMKENKEIKDTKNFFNT